jgi:hypothetical protein
MHRSDWESKRALESRPLVQDHGTHFLRLVAKQKRDGEWWIRGN